MEVKTYKKDDFAVEWRPQTCTHSKVCWSNLKSVFDPFRKPWIMLENADKETIKKQVMACPSGALRWIENPENNE